MDFEQLYEKKLSGYIFQLLWDEFGGVLNG